MKTKSLLEKLSNSIDFVGYEGAKKYQHIVPIRKPKQDVFFRVHSEPTWRQVALLHKESDSGEFFYVEQEIVSKFSGNLGAFVLYSAVTRQGDFFIWPVRLEDSLKRPNTWISSSHKIAKQAEEKWLKISSNQTVGSYEAFVAEGKIPDPLWPDEGFEEMLERAFKDRVVDSLDHPLIRSLKGLI